MDYLEFRSVFLAHYGIVGQKKGLRRFQSYEVAPTRSGMIGQEIGEAAKQRSRLHEHDRYAMNLYKKAEKVEPIITSDVSRSVISSGGKMYGLEHRLKTSESLSRKINADSVEKNISAKDASELINDSVRYTSVIPNNNFVKSYNETKRSLEKIGYKEVKCKNYFEQYKRGLVKHKSVQSVFKNPNGFKFEIQFHTPESQEAKNKKIPLYEARRQININPEYAKQLEKEMVYLAEKVPYPKGIQHINSH